MQQFRDRTHESGTAVRKIASRFAFFAPFVHHPYVTTPYLELDPHSRMTPPASASAVPTILVNRNAIDARLECALPGS